MNNKEECEKEDYCKLSRIDEIIAALYIFLRTYRFIKTAWMCCKRKERERERERERSKKLNEKWKLW